MPHKQAGHMTAPDQLQDVKLTLAKREPSTHDVMQNRSYRGSGKPVWVIAHLARVNDWDPIQRIALGPAATYAA